MRRREFVRLLGGAAAGWPFAVRAQGANLPKIGVLWPGAMPPVSPRMESFRLALRQFGYIEGQTVAIELRYAEKGVGQLPELAAELIRQQVDVITAFGDLAPKVAQQATETIPIVAICDDIVGAGLVASLAHPGGNITGFATYDGPMGGRWLDVLKQTAPHLTRILTILHPETPIHQAFWHSIQDAAPHFGVDVTPGGVHDGSEIENAITAFAVKENSGLIVLPHAVTNVNRDLIVALALRHSLPAIDAIGNANAGGLVSYGADIAASYPHAAEYVDRILRGQKPSDLPVQQPTKFILTFNLRTARVIGLELPHNLLVLADKVIE